jgi:hypothetical protein
VDEFTEFRRDAVEGLRLEENERARTELAARTCLLCVLASSVRVSLRVLSHLGKGGRMQESHGEDRVKRNGRTVRDRRVSRSSTAAPVLIFGSLALIVGTFLEWVGSRDQAVGASNGYQLPDGRVALGVGVALLLMGIIMAANKRVGSWFDADLLGVALSTIALVTVVALWGYLGSDNRSAEIGLYVTAGGALIAMAGSLAALLRSASDRATWDDEGEGDVGRNRHLAA